MFVFAPDSSRNTRRVKSRVPCCALHSLRRCATSARSCSLARSVFFIPIAQTLQSVVHRDNAAAQTHRVTQVLKRGIGSLLNEQAQLLHLRVVECRRIVSARERRGAARPAIPLQPPLKSRKVYPIELCHQRLRTLAVHVGIDGPLSNLSICDSRT